MVDAIKKLTVLRLTVELVASVDIIDEAREVHQDTLGEVGVGWRAVQKTDVDSVLSNLP